MPSQTPASIQRFIPAAVGAAGGVILGVAFSVRGDVGAGIWLLIPIGALVAWAGKEVFDRLPDGPEHIEEAPEESIDVTVPQLDIPDPPHDPNQPGIWHWFAMVVAVFGAGIFLHDCFSKKQSADPAESRVSANIGDTVLIASSNAPIVWVAVSSDAYKALDKAFFANDDEGVQELMQEGSVMTIQSGTPARYLDFEILGPSQVRILTGPFEGRKVWVSGASLK